MKIYTSYFGNLKNLKMETFSIARYSPQWYAGERLSCLMPSSVLLKKSRNENMPLEGEYEKLYIAELDSKKNEIKREIEKISKNKDIVLLCYEKDENECHRKLAGKYLAFLGFDVEGEFKKNDILLKNKKNIIEDMQLYIF